MITENVKKALEEYKRITDDMELDAKAKSIREELFSLKSQMDEILDELGCVEGPYRTKLAETEEYIKAQALEIATSFEHAGIKVSYRKGYERITWTSKEMDNICLKNPALLSVLAPARKVTPVDPSVSIAVLEVAEG